MSDILPAPWMYGLSHRPKCLQVVLDVWLIGLIYCRDSLSFPRTLIILWVLGNGHQHWDKSVFITMHFNDVCIVYSTFIWRSSLT